MDNIKYFFQFLFIKLLFLIFKTIGLNVSRLISGKLFSIIGPLFRSKKIIEKNLSIAFPSITNLEKKDLIQDMWTYYGKILAEYVFMKEFRFGKLNNKIKVNGQEILEKINLDKDPVIFISGHFDNFELMAMHLDKSNIKLAAIYRPLNNKFLNPLMESIRKKYICKNQIKKGISGTKELLKQFKLGSSIALMIDQRVSEGIRCKFFEKDAFTTSIPAQFIKKFNCKIVPIHIERTHDDDFKICIYKPIKFGNTESINSITQNLNYLLEEMIKKNIHQWIWTHNRWK